MDQTERKNTDPMIDFLMMDPDARAKVAPGIAEAVLAAKFAEPINIVTADTNTPTFEEFPKIPRLNRECVISEKLDGINAVIFIGERRQFEATIPPAIALTPDLFMYVGTRSQWITPYNDVHGLAKWAREHAAELFTLGAGRHHGEWWGSGVRRDYGLPRGEKRFSLYNTSRWFKPPFPKAPFLAPGMMKIVPDCCHVVPILARNVFSTNLVTLAIDNLRRHGSLASPGYKRPEGIVIYHRAANQMFKVTLEKDDAPKGKV